MAFAGSNLSLSTVTSAYGVPSLLGMRGKTSYGSNVDISTAITTGSGNVNLSSFFNRYSSSSGTLPDKSDSTTAFGFANSVTCGVSATSVSYTVFNGKLSSLTLTFSQSHSQGGSAVSSGNNSFEAFVYVDGSQVAYYTIPGTNTISGLIGSTTLQIKVTAQASNNLGIQTRATSDTTYTITPTSIAE